MTISIPTPCEEKWETFTPTSKGGFCSSCKKEVVDFTSWTPEEIQAYFTKKPFGSCGRFHATQLRNYPSPSPLKIQSPFKWLIPSLFGACLTVAPEESTGQHHHPVLIQTDNFTSRGVQEIQARAHVAERRTINGVVKDESNMPLPGANVKLKASGNGTVTDANGEYALVIPDPLPSPIIVFSFIGFLDEELSIEGKDRIDVTLKIDQAALNEEIIVGGVCTYRWYSPRGIWYKVKGIFRRRR